MSGLATDREPFAQPRDVGSLHLCQSHELLTLIHLRTLLPGHWPFSFRRLNLPLAKCYPCVRTCVTYLSGLYTPKGRREISFPNVWRKSRPDSTFCQYRCLADIRLFQLASTVYRRSH